MNKNFTKPPISPRSLILRAIILMVCSPIFLSCAIFQGLDMSSSGRAKQQVRVAAVGELGCSAISEVEVTEAGENLYLAKGCGKEATYNCTGPTCVKDNKK